MRSGNIAIIVRSDESMFLGLVLSVWKGGKKKTLCASACPLEGCHCFRAVQLTQVEEG